MKHVQRTWKKLNNKQYKRNSERSPDNFSFQIPAMNTTSAEVPSAWHDIVISFLLFSETLEVPPLLSQ